MEKEDTKKIDDASGDAAVKPIDLQAVHDDGDNRYLFDVNQFCEIFR